MSTRVFRNTLYAENVANNADVVVADCPIPSECSQNNVWGECHLWSTEAEPLDWEEAMMYGAEGWVLNVPDPDTTLTLNFLWDSQVPKDRDTSNFDIDQISATTSPFMDIGEINLENVMGLSVLQPDHQWFRRRKIMTWANNRVFPVAGTPDNAPVQDVFKIRSTKKISSELMAWSLLAIGVPQMGEIETSRNTFSTEVPWMQTKYIDVILEQAWVEMVGLTEAGAETPWTEAAAHLEELLEPDAVMTDAAGSANFVGIDLHVACQATFELQVPGRREVGVISGGR